MPHKWWPLQMQRLRCEICSAGWAVLPGLCPAINAVLSTAQYYTIFRFSAKVQVEHIIMALHFKFLTRCPRLAGNAQFNLLSMTIMIDSPVSRDSRDHCGYALSFLFSESNVLQLYMSAPLSTGCCKFSRWRDIDVVNHQVWAEKANLCKFATLFG